MVALVGRDGAPVLGGRRCRRRSGPESDGAHPAHSTWRRAAAISSAPDRPGGSSARRARRAGGAARRATGRPGRAGTRPTASPGTTYQLPSSISPASWSAPQPAYPAKIRIPARLPVDQLDRRVEVDQAERPVDLAEADRHVVARRAAARPPSAPSVLTGPPWKSTSGSATTSPQVSSTSATGTPEGRLSTTPRAPLVVDVEQQHDRVGEVGVEQRRRGHQQHPGAHLGLTRRP